MPQLNAYLEARRLPCHEATALSQVVDLDEIFAGICQQLAITWMIDRLNADDFFGNGMMVL